MTDINMKRNAKHNRSTLKCTSAIMSIYMNIFDKGHVSKWSNDSNKVKGITRWTGVVFYSTTAKARKFWMHDIWKSSRYRGERLGFRVLSVNDDNVVGHVWNHPVNRGLMFGQMLQIPICHIFDVLHKDYKNIYIFK